VNLSETAYFTLSLDSIGLKDVTASAAITVKDGSGRTDTTIRTGSVPIKSMESGTLTAEWDTDGMPAGRYYAEAAVDYGADAPLNLNSEFKIGDILVNIINVTHPDDIYPDTIVRLDVFVDSFWNDGIQGSYITLDVSRDGLQAGAQRRSESFDLAPWETRAVPLYWDTTGLDEGSYDGVISVHYAGRQETRSVVLEVEQRPSPYVALILALVAAALAIAAFAAFRKRRGKRGAAAHGG
jgi:hypothetical protein